MMQAKPAMGGGTSASPPLDPAFWRIERSSFIGREDQIRDLSIYLEDGARLVTIFGAPGLGKTRLLRRLGGLLADEGASVWFCDLAAASDAGDVLAVVTRTLGIPMVLGGTELDAVVQLGHALAARGRVALLLDNLERVVAHAGAIVSRWLVMAPSALFIASSRETLELEEEVCFELPSLEPEEGARLFEDRARAAHPGLVLTPSDRAAVTGIIERLDGIPLAIELAAARMAMLSPTQIAARLSSRFQLLRTQRRDVDPRHATLERAIDWSYESLAPWEKAAFVQCAVFRGGFSLEAAEAVIDLSDFPEAPPILDALQALRHKSLVRRYAPPGFPDDTRLGLFESLLEYADRKLDEASRREAEARHACFYVEQAERWAEQVSGPTRREALDGLRLESDNLLRIVHQHARAPELAFRAALALDVLLVRMGPLTVRLNVLQAVALAAARCGDSAQTLRYLRARADAKHMSYKIDDACADFEEALLLARRTKDTSAETAILVQLGDVALYAVRLDEARARHEEAMLVARRSGDPAASATLLGGAADAGEHEVKGLLKWIDAQPDRRASALAFRSLAARGIMWGHMEQGLAAAERGRLAARDTGDAVLEAEMEYIASYLERALDRVSDTERLERALAAHRALGNRSMLAMSLPLLGPFRLAEGRLAEARAIFEECLVLAAETGYPLAEHAGLTYLAVIEAESGDLDLAEKHLAAAWVSVRANGATHQLLAKETEWFEAVVDLARARRAKESGREDLARAHHAAARARAESVRGPVPGEQRRIALFVRPILERALAAYEGSVAVAPRHHRAPVAATAPAERADLELCPDGRWFRTAEVGTVKMMRRQAMRRILLRLVEQHLAAPGVCVRTSELIQVGWPGERILPQAAANRIHNAIAVLRSLGLRDALLTFEDGYILAPHLRVSYQPNAPR